jgi:hypothetical protein
MKTGEVLEGVQVGNQGLDVVSAKTGCKIV